MMNSTEKSLPEKLSDDIIAYILEEQLQPNDKLPNESVLSEKMGAGRSSIREAMKLLEPAIAEMAALHAEETDIRKISTLCDEVEALLLRGEDHTGKDIEFHTAIAMSSKNLVVPRLIPVINSSIPLFIQLTNNRLLHETIETHREITDAIAAHDTLRAKDAMYLHLVYNRRCLLDQKA